MLNALARAFGGPRPFDIGLHLGTGRLSLVQVESGRDAPTLRAAASVEFEGSREALLADPRKLRRVIRGARARQAFRGNRVVTCLPGGSVELLLINYTVAEGASEPEAIARELRERVPEGLEDRVVDYVALRQDQSPRPKEAIVAMARQGTVVDYLDALTAAGVEVVALDIASAALARLMSWVSAVVPGAFPNLLLINFGARTSHLTVLWGRRLMLDRPIGFSEHRLISRLKTVLDLSEQESRRVLTDRGLAENANDELGQAVLEVLRPEFAALKSEVEDTLQYTASRTRGRGVDSAYVVGTFASYPGILSLLGTLFPMPVRLLDPCGIFKHSLDPSQQAWLRPCEGVAAATGLALRGVPVSWQT